jgi:type I restriction enzyme S subunit
VSELPKGWVETKISEVTEYVQRGKGPKYTDVKSFPVVNQKAIRWFGLQEEHLKYVREDMWDKYTEERFIRSGDILWNSTGTGTIGRACLLDDKEAGKAKVVDSHVTIVRSNKSIDPRYLFNWIKSPKIQFDIESLSTGTTNQVELSKAKVLDTIIPLAPLNEQIRIADKLDSILAKVDAAQARLDKIPNILKRFRQSVLSAATSGELTKEWRRNDEVIESVASTWEFKNLPINWQVKLLPELGSSRLGKMLDKSKNVGIETKYLGNINVRWNSFDLDDLKEIKVSEKEIVDLSIQNGDLIICEGGVPGRGAIWKGGKNNLVFQKALHRIRFEEKIIPEFALYSIQDDYNSSKLSSLYTGTTIKHLTGKALKIYPLRVPPIDEQKEIVRRVESLFTMANTVEKKFNDAKARTDRLTQSILAKAFSGELVLQDENDEPASELLRKLKASLIKKPVKKVKKKVAAKPKKPVSSSKDNSQKEFIRNEPEKQVGIDFTDEQVKRKNWLGDNFIFAERALQNLKDTPFTTEQFQSITSFSKSYDELKALILTLVKGIPGTNEPLFEIADWDEKTGNYSFKIKD